MKKLSKKEKEKIRLYFERQPEVIVVYLFGSQCQKEIKTPNDVDLAILLKEEISLRKLLQFRAELKRITGISNLDIAVLNNAPPLLKYEVISSGEIILVKDEDIQFKFESQSYLHFFDTHYLRKVQDDYLLSDGS